MFTPFRNFITYIQKNTSGSGIFGTGTTPTKKSNEMLEDTAGNIKTAANAVVVATDETTPTTTAITNTKTGSIKEVKNLLTIKKEHIIPVTVLADIPSKAQHQPFNNENTNRVNALAAHDVDDVELQIKTSIMVKPAAVNGEKCENPAMPFNNGIRRMSILRRPSISLQTASNKVAATPFIPPRHLARKIVDTKKKPGVIPCAVIKPLVLVETTEKLKEVTPLEIATNLEDDSEKEFLDISLPEIPNSEIIVLNCVENNSMPSESPTEDPLALDLNISNTTNSSCGDLQDTVENVAEYWLPTEDLHSMNNAANAAVCDTQSSQEQQAEEVRSEGSDSGLGTEGQLPKLQQPLRSNLKRRSDNYSLEREEKRHKRSINFEGVKVYYFQRQQGFSCVPSAGGCTLGMSSQHIGFKTMTLAEHAAELRRAHRLQLQEINARGSSSDDSEESEEDFLSEGSGSDLDAESNGFLQPVSPKQRRALLKAAGVRKIDANEKIECRDIRNSREVCGCSCRDFCDPETCACSQSGIKCQVDRTMFPCGCSREACGNTVGRVEFNPARVRTHFIHTIMRLEMENRQQQPHMHMTQHHNNNNDHGNMNNYSMSPSHYYSQSQLTTSNYSSGYASPAYNNESSMGSQSQASYYTLPQTHYGNGYGVDSYDGTNNLYAHNYNEIHSTAIGSNYNQLYALRPMNYNNWQQSNHDYAQMKPANNFNDQTTTSIFEETPTTSTATPLTSNNFGGSYNVDDEIITGGDTSSFINLSAPVANATRLSQINDLLQHNRETTATLVAVNQNHINPAFTVQRALVTRSVTSSPSPAPSPTSSTTISVEHDDTSNTTIAESGMILAETLTPQENLNEPTNPLLISAHNASLGYTSSSGSSTTNIQ